MTPRFKTNNIDKSVCKSSSLIVVFWSKETAPKIWGQKINAKGGCIGYYTNMVIIIGFQAMMLTLKKKLIVS